MSFYPQRPFVQIALKTTAAVAVAGGFALAGWKVAEWRTPERAPPMAPEEVAALQHAAFAQAETRPGYARAENVAVKVRPGETLERAIARAGVAPEEARQAVAALGRLMDTVHIKAGMPFEAAIAHPRQDEGQARLIGLALRVDPATSITVSRSFDGAMQTRALAEKVTQETTVANGEIHGSLYESAAKLGATPAITAEVVKLFAHKLDFERDLKAGDEFRLVFDRRVTESGRTVETGELEYAEVKGVKFFRFQRNDGDVQYFDETGKNIKGFLLRTPVDGARLTSRFGMRRHPILGYARAHQGVDFGAGHGTPVLAAGDGVVVKASRWRGYGNWLQIRHSGGWDTGYAHLSRYAKGVKPGTRVRQGQVVAYVGSTGMSTGPHLHYEVWRQGKRVNPVGAKVPQGTVLAGAELARFKAEKARLERLIAEGVQPAVTVASR